MSANKNKITRFTENTSANAGPKSKGTTKINKGYFNENATGTKKNTRKNNQGK